MTDTPKTPDASGDFAKASLVIYAPDAASQKAAEAARQLIEKNGGSVEIRKQNPPYSFPGIH